MNLENFINWLSEAGFNHHFNYEETNWDSEIGFYADENSDMKIHMINDKGVYKYFIELESYSIGQYDTRIYQTLSLAILDMINFLKNQEEDLTDSIRHLKAKFTGCNVSEHILKNVKNKLTVFENFFIKTDVSTNIM